MSKKTNNQTAKVNWPITILLIIGCLTVFFPLYMAVIIAFKQPSEMTNDIAGALAFPKTWSFANFSEAMKVTDFWHSLGNSLLLTIVTVILAILIHSLAGYAIGRSMANKKFYNFAYLYIVSGMFVPFAILMMRLVKQTAQISAYTLNCRIAVTTRIADYITMFRKFHFSGRSDFIINF